MASAAVRSAPGSLEDDNKTKLEEGMTFIIHPNQYLPETGYLTLGDTVVMGKIQGGIADEIFLGYLY